MSQVNNNLSKVENRSRGKSGKEAHPSLPQKSKNELQECR